MTRWPDIIDGLIDAVLTTLPGACVGRVEAYDVATQTADVLPLAQSWSSGPDGTREAVPAVVLRGVPVVWPYVIRSLDEGERVLLLPRGVSHRELDLGAEGPLMPAARARHQLGDAAAIPLLTPDGQGREDGQPLAPLRPGEALHIGGETYELVRVDRLETWIGDVRVWLAAHVHGGAGTPPTDLPVPAPPALGSTRVRVDG